MDGVKITMDTFRRVRCAQRDIADLRERIQRVRERMERVTQQYQASGTRGGGGDSMAAGQAALDQLERTLAARKLLHLRDLAALIGACAQLNGLMGEVTWDYYIDGRRIEDIAQTRHYSDGYIRLLLHKARNRLADDAKK